MGGWRWKSRQELAASEWWCTVAVGEDHDEDGDSRKYGFRKWRWPRWLQEAVLRMASYIGPPTGDIFPSTGPCSGPLTYLCKRSNI
ncbi:hypothetical protein L6452_44514 [Arctium lappa]|uniref:Uncharacterized protein n=1 Tax=Arctium lappa TaxID=4217 RepID=A0ACB8XFG4_ARCLA|nr:hypothetical protein L6452_44514 [Arctium lappa]